MSSLRRIVTAIQPAWTWSNECMLNVATVPPRRESNDTGSSARPRWRGPRSEEARHDDNYEYATPDYWYLRKVITALQLGPQDVVYDLGSGFGRFLCLAARERVRKCIGVELLPPMCAIARENASRLRGRKAPIEIVCGDCALTDLSQGTVYFMFNPFGADTMRDTLANINASLETNPRSIRLVYYNPVHEAVLEQSPWLKPVTHFQTVSGMKIAFWRN